MPRKKIEYRTASRENYTLFCHTYPDIALSFTQWATIIYTFNYNFRDHLLESGDRVKMPWGFGDFMVAKKKKKKTKILPDGTEKINLSINWKASRAAGKRIYHLNYHTEGYNFYWRWEPRTARIYQPQVWRFTPSRVSSRLLCHYLKQPGYQHLYKEWDRI